MPVFHPAARTAKPRALATAALTVLLLAATLLAPGATADAAVRVATPAVPAGLPRSIEPMADYVGQVACDLRAWPGTTALAALLRRTYPDTSTATTYSCGTDGTRSEHYDGRAIDWMASLRNPRQAAEAGTFLSWLLATDRSGNRFAMARRLGVMYVIWDNRMWGAWDGTWQPYQNCGKTPQVSADSYCHRNHVHISLGWNGAMARTSFYSRRVDTVTDFGPCRPSDLNWATPYRTLNTRSCPSYPKVAAPRGATATKQALVRYSGAYLTAGMRGPAVAAVQTALHVQSSGWFGPLTRAAVIAFQRAHRLPVTAAADPGTWRTLLRATR